MTRTRTSRNASQVRHPKRTASGFTLIEVMVASLASAILIVSLYGVFSRSIRLRDNATSRIETLRNHQQAARIIRDDLRHGLVTGARLAATLEGSPQSENSRFPGYLKITTATGPNTPGNSYGDLQEVAYFITNDPWSTNQNAGALVRTIDQNLLAQIREISREDVLLHNVEALEVRFFDGNNWLDSWDFVDTESSLPAAVEVTIQPAGYRTNPNQTPPAIQILELWSVQTIATSTNTESATSDSNTNNPQQNNPPGGGGGGGQPQPPGQTAPR